ncbi:HD domain-containing protein [Jinshanibacter sp. LJY008]|uniref:HD domain-containing protein n=1 Tax=Limnobaculum eriocheiris TaxID=2897391 RepID=A0A9X1MXY0_9GAMM|nr:HD domain-containing protein [Limnobaculum eriocheiris]MCD1126655.1 HD domain-containing protein [Limnobaculum eriocheiris]
MRQSMGELERRARVFATQAHTEINQRRKYTNAPYIVHPAAVVELVRSVPHTQEMIAAAWLHDTVEDTMVSLKDIEQYFGHRVANYVEMLTKVSRSTDGDRKARFHLDLMHTARACPEAKTIKLADIIDNSRNIAHFDPEFAVDYLGEKRNQLEVLVQGDRGLFHRAEEMVMRGIDDAKRRLSGR